MLTPGLCTGEEVHDDLVHTFYTGDRADARLGPIFEARVRYGYQISRRPESLPQVL